MSLMSTSNLVVIPNTTYACFLGTFSKNRHALLEERCVLVKICKYFVVFCQYLAIGYWLLATSYWLGANLCMGHHKGIGRATQCSI